MWLVPSIMVLLTLCYAEGYEDCKKYECFDNWPTIRYCCPKIDEDGLQLCCSYTVWWALWYFWFGLIFVIFLLAAFAITCCNCKNRNRDSSDRSSPSPISTVTTGAGHTANTIMQRENVEMHDFPPSYQEIQKQGITKEFEQWANSGRNGQNNQSYLDHFASITNGAVGDEQNEAPQTN